VLQKPNAKLSLKEIIGDRIMGKGYKSFTGHKGIFRVGPKSDFLKHVHTGPDALKSIEGGVMVTKDAGACSRSPFL
jgi:hypothetical protein